MENNLAKNYRPKDFEDRIYAQWEENGAFAPDANAPKDPFTVMMPPPNITGQLHMGHALDQSLQDVLIRYKRMQGHETLWLPGTDHASIATEVKVVDKLREEEGLSKEDIGREAFLERAWEWKRQYGGRINEQIRRLGSSCDWKRERFTMDEGCNRAVKEHFINLYNKGLIYKGARLINWCPVCGSALSDIEVEHVDHNGSYWYFRYPGADGSEGIVVATSRPETMFADTAVAVHPSDERYRDLVGKKVILPLVGREIPVIADEYPDPEKGTGAVKITPSADPNDFEVGLRHGLEMIECIDEKAKMTAAAGKYEGMDRYECRKAWVADLEAAGYLVKVEKMVIPAGECYRCHTVVEPRISEQWFVKMKPLAEPAIEAVRKNETKFVPERFDKTYYHWMEDIKDWCISRQLWWGHRIPAYYCEDCGEMVVAKEEPSVCPKCGGTHFHQDEDVLDTWFSSALWPFSTLGWPENTDDLKKFYPTSTLVTGYDIIFFWVARMIFSGIEVMGKTPFEHVLIHGLVRDAQGRKMSKSLGNGIDPLEVIDTYGADALRFMLLSGISPGSDIRYQVEKVEGARNFANKLWNASRFAIMNIKDEEGNFLPMADEATAKLQAEDRWILQTVNDALPEINTNMERFEFALAAQKIYELIWGEFCDWYIELIKPRLYGADEEDKASARYCLVKCLKSMLKLLHPFMPFITEEIWSFLPREEDAKQFLMLESWPAYDPSMNYEQDKQVLNLSMEIIKAIRGIRHEAEALPSRKLHAVILAEKDQEEAAKAGERYIKTLGNLEGISWIASKDELPEETMSAALPGVEVYVPLDDLMDYEAEYARLKKEEERLTKEVARVTNQLANEKFVSRAPAHVIQAERDKLAGYQDMLEKTLARIPVVEKKLNR
ncbi:MAG: valine--tRNA ligase [Firmicutes bacterium]|nr:valine--tRNA ligase [Bacillota bacterium]MBR0051806.1 valine--tRNA ligase [Bacillota bacterium]